LSGDQLAFFVILGLACNFSDTLMNDEQIKLMESGTQNRLKHLNRKFDVDGATIKVLLGKLLAKLKQVKVSSPQDAGFRMFAQFGDNYIIHYLVHSLDIKYKHFIGFLRRTIKNRTPDFY
jgi:hypothetical protein